MACLLSDGCRLNQKGIKVSFSEGETSNFPHVVESDISHYSFQFLSVTFLCFKGCWYRTWHTFSMWTTRCVITRFRHGLESVHVYIPDPPQCFSSYATSQQPCTKFRATNSSSDIQRSNFKGCLFSNRD